MYFLAKKMFLTIFFNVLSLQLFHFLDLDAPTLPKKKAEFSNLVLLLYELMCREVFSHDTYMCQLISRWNHLKFCSRQCRQ